MWRAGKSTAAWMLGSLVVLVVLVLLARGCYGLVYNQEDQPKAELIIAALDAYRARNARYPPTDALVPQFMPQLPVPRQYGIIEYIVDEAGEKCWVAYNTHRDYVKEYDCRTRQWLDLDYDDREKRPGVDGQVLKGPPPASSLR
jgi:hypothetical protein